MQTEKLLKFKDLKVVIDKQFKSMSENSLFRTGISKDKLWETYLNSFPDGTNPIFRERTEYDCQCCKQFIRACGDVVTIVNGKLISIWDIEVGGQYQPVVDAMSQLAKSEHITDVFLHYEKNLGTDHNIQLLETGSTLTWNHFHFKLPARYVKNKDSIGTKLSELRSNKEVFKRGLEEITLESVETVLELIEQGSLYRGAEHKPILELFVKHKEAFDKIINTTEIDNYCWTNSKVIGNASKIRNTVIGTLLTDISDGMELDKAVKVFESKVAPMNYKRPTALVTKGMIDKAQKKVEELGIGESLQRRYAVVEDITINNVLFADRNITYLKGNIFEELKEGVVDKKPNLKKVEDVDVKVFIDDILPKADSIELFVENSHISNFMSLVAPINPESKRIFKWDNNFSWSYNGEVTDSMKERVQALGGRVDGVLRFTHSWNHRGDNQSLMDLHVFMPGSGYKSNGKGIEKHDRYPVGQRVGWNRRTDMKSKGRQDVDYTAAPGKSIPLENITFPELSFLKDGKYIFKIHNWSVRQPNKSGFKAEIEFGGELYQYEYTPALKDKEWVTLAVATLKDGKFTIEHKLPLETSSKKVWNISTQKFQKVSMIMNSPNHWDNHTTGNKHWFFILDKCKNDEKTRGFYNEFLSNDLTEHRKVFEVLGAKMKTEKCDNQLSGIGFSSTQKNSILCRVSGSFSRTIKINF